MNFFVKKGKEYRYDFIFLYFCLEEFDRSVQKSNCANILLLIILNKLDYVSYKFLSKLLDCYRMKELPSNARLFSYFSSFPPIFFCRPRHLYYYYITYIPYSYAITEKSMKYFPVEAFA